MHKRILYGIAIIVAAIGGFFLLNAYIYHAEQGAMVTDYKNATYTISGEPVTLVNGVSETEAAPDSASKITTRYFGNEVRHDFNADGREDIAFLLTQQTGGTGTFYYVVAALSTENGYVGSEGVFLGDRIAPQTTEIKGNLVVVNYAHRAPGESFTVAPSVGKSVHLLLDPKTLQFGEVAQNFEGEADPGTMTLTQKKWTWVSAAYPSPTSTSDKKVIPKQPNAFTITFSPNGRFTATTDCNSVGGSYETAGEGGIGFDQMVSTLRYCADSQESVLTGILNNASTYHFTSKGELILELMADGGSATFR
ncbi:MAG TPA: META domain-containing protein [Candidatus Paceibacterota bacterium]|nr:META domain-containing protein [Candidatus Paceibacterota bacterium]